jgi:putative FmdB family regulatory protein
MPLYDYKCKECGKVTEVRHGFNEGHADPCPACGGAVRRVFSAAPIVFKGSGYYVTDSRKSSAGASESPAAEAAKPAAESSSDPSPAAAPAKPAAPAESPAKNTESAA